MGSSHFTDEVGGAQRGLDFPREAVGLRFYG